MGSRFLIALAILMASAACAPSEGAIQTSIALTQAALPTDTPAPPTATSTLTAAPSPTFTLAPTATIVPSPTPSRFFTEEFDQPLNEFWTFILFGPNKDEVSRVETEVSDSRLRVNITREDIYAYYFFEQFSYSDVRLDMRAENRGRRTNNVSLICRESEEGWYEFSVGSDAAWYLFYAHIPKGETDARYRRVANGATLALKQGNAVNQYTMICDGETITLMVNDTELKGSPISETIYKLKEGSVGMNVSSLYVTPVIVDFDWLKISAP